MPSTSTGYVNGRISVLRREQLTPAQLERLLGAGSLEEALRLLQDAGWVTGDLHRADPEAVAARHMQEVCAFVRDNAPQQDAVDPFLLHYDTDNLKTLIKARTLGISPPALSACGTMPVEALAHAVHEGVYRNLPPALSEPLAELEKRLAVAVDAMDIDVTLDQALYALIFEKLARVSSPTIHTYFESQVDWLNALALLRFVRMGRDAAEYERVWLAGGRVSLEALTRAYGEPERLPRLYAAYPAPLVASLAAAVETGALAPLEKAVDDSLLSLFRPFKFQPARLEAVIGYLLGQQREVAAVRLVLAAKRNGFAPETVLERLRELHG